MKKEPIIHMGEDMEDDNHEVADKQKQQIVADNLDVFQILTSDDKEYYSQCIPYVKNGGLFVTNLINKGVVEEQIMNETIQQFYAIEISEMFFSLKEGIVLKNISIEKIPWIKTSSEEATSLLKDEVLTYYKTVVPQLLNRVANLEERNRNNMDYIPNRVKPNDLML